MELSKGWCAGCGGWIPAGVNRPLVSGAPRQRLCVKSAACVNARWELLSANPRSARNFQTEFQPSQASRFRTFAPEHTILTYLWTRDVERWAEGDASRLEKCEILTPSVLSSAAFILELILCYYYCCYYSAIIDMMNLKALWTLVVFICYVREGFSRDEANLKTNHLLQVCFYSFPLGAMEFN